MQFPNHNTFRERVNKTQNLAKASVRDVHGNPVIRNHSGEAEYCYKRDSPYPGRISNKKFAISGESGFVTTGLLCTYRRKSGSRSHSVNAFSSL